MWNSRNIHFLCLNGSDELVRQKNPTRIRYGKTVLLRFGKGPVEHIVLGVCPPLSGEREPVNLSSTWVEKALNPQSSSSLLPHKTSEYVFLVTCVRFLRMESLISNACSFAFKFMHFSWCVGDRSHDHMCFLLCREVPVRELVVNYLMRLISWTLG